MEDSRHEDQRELEQELLLRLKKALEQLQLQEGLGGEERLENLVFQQVWSGASDLAGARETLGLAREAAGRLPRRTWALVAALEVLLGELLLALATAETEDARERLRRLWDQGMLNSRLRHHYLLELVGGEGQGQVAARRHRAEAAGLAELRRRLARRWEDELMPLAVGLVLCEAGILCRQEDWRQLVRGRPDRMRFRLEPNSRQRRFLDRLCRILPEATSRLRDDLEKLLWGDDPAEWYQRRPSAGYVAFIIRYLLHDTPWPYLAESDGEEPEARQEELRQFLESWKALVAQGLKRKLGHKLRELDSRFASLPADKLLDVLEGLGSEPGLSAQVQDWLDCLDQSKQPAPSTARQGKARASAPSPAGGAKEATSNPEAGGPVSRQEQEENFLRELLAAAIRRIAENGDQSTEEVMQKLGEKGGLEEKDLSVLRDKVDQPHPTTT